MKKKFLILMSTLGISFTSFAGENVLKIMEALPNKKGNLDKLYLIDGKDVKGNLILENTEILPKKSKNIEKVTIFHINDVHGNIMKLTKKGNIYTLAQMKKIVDDYKTKKADNEAVFWVTAGDDHIGNAFDELLGTDEESFIMSPVYKAYSQAGMDFAVPGNHEFDKTTSILSRAIEENANFPVISSNIFNSKFKVKDGIAAIGLIDGLRVGVIGLTTPEETKLASDKDPDIYAIEPIEALNKVLPLIEEHSDVILVLSHIGYEKGDRYTIAKGDLAVADAVGKITDKPAIVVGGHTHHLLNINGLEPENVINGVAVVQTGEYGKEMGKVTFNLKNNNTEAGIIPLYSLENQEKNYDEKYQQEIIEPMYKSLQERLEAPIGKTGNTVLVSKEINTYDRYIGESAMANYFNDAVVSRSHKFSTGHVDFCIFNATGISGLDPSSDIKFKDMHKLFPYADTISVVEMTGKDIKDIIENNAPRIVKEENLKSNGGKIDPNGFVETGFLNFSSGIRYDIKLGKNSIENRAINIKLNGKNIDDVLDQKYKIAISSYLVIGRGGWHGKSVGQGLPENFIGYNLKELCTKNGKDLGLIFRNEIISYIIEDSKGIISEKNGVKKDGRLKIIK